MAEVRRSAHAARAAVRQRSGELAWRVYLKNARHSLASPLLDPARLLWVDPCSITEMYDRSTILSQGRPRRTQRFVLGQQVGGEWDLSFRRFDDLTVVGAIGDRVRGADWADTRLPEVVGARPRYAGGPKSAVEEYLRKVDRLIDVISAKGYRSQRELGTGRDWDEIVVAIARDGAVRFFDGRHRLAIAASLGIPEVPVIVSLRHQLWVDRLVTHDVSSNHPDAIARD